jgi:UDP-N-acetylmuramoyl-L-alanyl-D-glutamate--2,6-diaminopimelate ligase
MRLADLIVTMPDLVHLAPRLRAEWAAAAELQVIAVTSDSRQVRHGTIFVAIKGTQQDGRRFIPEAVARGAVAVLAQPRTIWPIGTPRRPLIEDPEPRRRLARMAALLAGPQPRTLVAITGTNGKTSTADFLRQLWRLSGQRAASVGTLGVVTNEGASGPGLTTPDPAVLAETLASLSRWGVRSVAVEASSHGLAQFRLDGLRFAAGAFTNLTRDHLDYHGSIDSYREAKLRLFQELLPPRSPVVASTALDKVSLAALRRIAHRRRHMLMMVGEGGEAIDLIRAEPRPDGLEIEVEIGGVRREIALALPGRFQADNVLMAVALAQATGVANALDLAPQLVGVRGRMELAARLDNGAAVYVDFAHTPDALERLITALRPHTERRLVVVFGAGGDRDRGKRPLMGAMVARLADRAIVTDDNPRSEDPAAIRAEVLAGCPGGVAIGGRAEAIAAGLGELGPGDVLVVAGKGHEQGQTIGNVTVPFDDVATVRRLAGLA